MTIYYKNNLQPVKIAPNNTTYTLTSNDSVYLGYNGQTINLPNVATSKGQRFNIKLPTTYTTGITINAGSAILEGNTTYTITSDYGFVELVSDGTNWSIINSSIKLLGNLASALDIKEGSNSYLKFVTTTGSESITANKSIIANASFKMPSQELTISSGAINVANASFIILIPEDPPSADGVSTINGGTDGQVIVLTSKYIPINGNYEISVTDTGNIRTPLGGLSNTVFLSNEGDCITLIYNANISKWMTLSYNTGNAIM